MPRLLKRRWLHVPCVGLAIATSIDQRVPSTGVGHRHGGASGQFVGTGAPPWWNAPLGGNSSSAMARAAAGIDRMDLSIAAVALIEMQTEVEINHKHAHVHRRRRHHLRAGDVTELRRFRRPLREPISLEAGELRQVALAAATGRQKQGGLGTRPGAPLPPAKPLRPIADVIIGIVMSIIMFVIGIVKPIVMPLLMILFQYVGPLLIIMLLRPLIATTGPVLLNLAQKSTFVNTIIQYLSVPFWNLYIGLMQPPGLGMPYMSFHGPPYGSSYGQVATENMRCYSMLEEYIKRCSAPPNTLPTSYLEISSETTHFYTPGEAYHEKHASRKVHKGESSATGTSFLELGSSAMEPGVIDLRHNIYAGMGGGGFFHAPIRPGYNSPDPYDPYGPDGPESDPAPNLAFKRCREMLDTWLNSCGTPTG